MMCIIFANKLEQQTDTRQRDGINFCVCLWPGNVDIFHLACRAIWLKLHLLIYDNDSVQLQSSVEAVAECEFELPKHASPRIMTCPMPDARPMLVIIAHLGAGPWLWEVFTLTLALRHAGIYVNGKRKLLNKQDMLWAALGHTQDPSRTRTIHTSPAQTRPDQARPRLGSAAEVKTKHLLCKAFDVVLGRTLSAGCSETTCQWQHHFALSRLKRKCFTSSSSFSSFLLSHLNRFQPLSNGSSLQT